MLKPATITFHTAIKLDKCSVRGFVASTLLDSFMGTRGYSEKSGLYHVNFTDSRRSRSPKASALALANVIRDNGFSHGYRLVSVCICKHTEAGRSR